MSAPGQKNAPVALSLKNRAASQGYRKGGEISAPPMILGVIEDSVGTRKKLKYNKKGVKMKRGKGREDI